MVIRFRGHLEVDVPQVVVFELLADMAELHRWNPNVTTSRRVSGDRFVAGSTYESIIRRGPIQMTARSELTAVEAGRYVEYQGWIASFWSVDSLTFDGSGDGTRITFRNETTTPWWMRPVAAVLNASFQPQARRAVKGAARYLAETGVDS